MSSNGTTQTDGGALIPNPWNQLIAQRHALLSRAQRFPLATTCDPQGKPVTTPQNRRSQLKTIQINAQASGDNILIPALAGVKQIYEMLIWNVGAQTIVFQQGLTGSSAQIPWFPLAGFPALTALVLGFNGNFEQPHFEVDNNQPLVMNLSGATAVTGFIRYRVNSGTS